MPTTSRIKDQTFLFTGTLKEFTRDEAESLVVANGGKVLSGVSGKLNYLVVGEDAGSKLVKAKSIGTVKIITEKEFLKMVPKSKVTSSKKKKDVIEQSVVDASFTFARHYSSKVSKYHGLEIAVGQLSSTDIGSFAAFIEDEEYFDSKFFREFYSFDNLLHTQGVLVDSTDKTLSKLKDSRSLSHRTFIDKVINDSLDIPKKGVFLCSIRNEDVYLVAKGTANVADNKVPVACRVLRLDFLKASFGVLHEVSVLDEVVNRDPSGIEDAAGQVHDLQQLLIVDGVLKLVIAQNGMSFPLLLSGNIVELNDDYLTKSQALKCFKSNLMESSKSTDPEVNKIIQKLGSGDYYPLEKVKEKYRHNPQVVAKACEVDGSNLAYVSDEQKADKNLVKTAVKSYPRALQYADSSLKSDLKYVLELLNLDGNIIEYVSDELKKSKDVATAAVSNKASAIRFLHYDLRSDETIINTALTDGLVNDKNPTVIEFLPLKHKDSKDVALKVLNLNGYELRHVSDRLKADYECVMTACKRNGYALTYATVELRSSLDFYYKLLEFTKNSHILEYFADSIRDNEQALLEAAKYDGLHYTEGQAGAIIKFASDRLKGSKEFILKFIDIAPYVLDYISKDLAKDKEIKAIAKKY